MNEPSIYRVLADIVLTLHVLVVMFIMGGLVFIVWGNRRAWPWVNTLWFRGVHLAAIAVVVAQSWVGLICPLTTLEVWLRKRAGASTYVGGFIEHWLQRLLYYDAPDWAFTLGYTLFGLAILAVWWRFPPRRIRSDPGSRPVPGDDPAS